MISVNWNSALADTYAANAAGKSAPAGTQTASAAKTQTANQGHDVVQLSPAALREIALTGRVAQNAQAGNVTADQATDLDGQISSIQSQIAADQQADGGTLSSADAQTIQQMQTQLSQTIYSDAHNGAAAPADPNGSVAGAREAIQAGRIALNEKAGNLSGTQANQLYSQLGTIHQQIVSDQKSDGGSLSQADKKAIQQSLTTLSQQISDTAHPTSSPDPQQ